MWQSYIFKVDCSLWILFSFIHWGPISLPYFPLKLKQRSKTLLICVSTGRFLEACLLVCFPPRDQIRLGLGKVREKGRVEKQIKEYANVGGLLAWNQPYNAGIWTLPTVFHCPVLLCLQKAQERDCKRGGGWRSLLLSCSFQLPVCLQFLSASCQQHAFTLEAPYNLRFSLVFSNQLHCVATSPHPHSLLRGLSPSSWGDLSS